MSNEKKDAQNVQKEQKQEQLDYTVDTYGTNEPFNIKVHDEDLVEFFEGEVKNNNLDNNNANFLDPVVDLNEKRRNLDADIKCELNTRAITSKEEDASLACKKLNNALLNANLEITDTKAKIRKLEHEIEKNTDELKIERKKPTSFIFSLPVVILLTIAAIIADSIANHDVFSRAFLEAKALLMLLTISVTGIMDITPLPLGELIVETIIANNKTAKIRKIILSIILIGILTLSFVTMCNLRNSFKDDYKKKGANQIFENAIVDEYSDEQVAAKILLLNMTPILSTCIVFAISICYSYSKTLSNNKFLKENLKKNQKELKEAQGQYANLETLISKLEELFYNMSEKSIKDTPELQKFLCQKAKENNSIDADLQKYLIALEIAKKNDTPTSYTYLQK